MDKVFFADGTELNCIFFGLSTVGKLFITVNATFQQAAVIFSDAGKTAEITYAPESGEPTTMTGYTVFEYMVNEENGVRAALRKPFIGENAPEVPDPPQSGQSILQRLDDLENRADDADRAIDALISGRTE